MFLVSGGFRQIIHPIAQMLDIPLSNVYANTIQFDAQSGAYTGEGRQGPSTGGLAQHARLVQQASCARASGARV